MAEGLPNGAIAAVPSPENVSLTDTEVAKLQDRVVFMTGTSNPELARDVVACFDNLIGTKTPTALQKPTFVFDEGGEIGANIPTNVRGKDVIIIHPTGYNVERNVNTNDALFQLFTMADAAIKAGANKVTAAIPYYGYARQDRKGLGREPITAALVAKFLQRAGVRGIVTVDVHAPQIEGAFDGGWDDLWAIYPFLSILQEKLPNTTVVVSPDQGGVRRAERMGKGLNAQVASIYKLRSLSEINSVETKGLMGNVEGLHALIVDDIFATGQSLMKAVELLLEHGAVSVDAAITHGQFYGGDETLQRLSDSPLGTVYTTDTIAHRRQIRENPKIVIVSVADMLAKAVFGILTGTSVSELIKN